MLARPDDAGHRGRGPRRPLRPALHPQDDPARGRSGRCSAAATRAGFWALQHVSLRLHARRVAGGHRPQRRRQEHAPPGPGRDHPPVAGLGRRPRPRVRAADPRRRLRQGAERPRQHPAGRGVPRPRRRASRGGCMPSIIEYAELGEFIDAPLKTYSSGMRARLGLRHRHRRSTRTSCSSTRSWPPATPRSGRSPRQRVIEIVKAAKAVVLVTHDMGWVTEYCNRALLIERGRVIMEGDPAEVVALHQAHMEEDRHAAHRRRRGGRGRPADRARPVTEPVAIGRRWRVARGRAPGRHPARLSRRAADRSPSGEALADRRRLAPAPSPSAAPTATPVPTPTPDRRRPVPTPTPEPTPVLVPAPLTGHAHRPREGARRNPIAVMIDDQPGGAAADPG